jgi:hypothetical protein
VSGKVVLHAGDDGSELKAERWLAGTGVALSVDDGGGLVDVSADDFPALAAGLYEAAGLPAPVILERPDVPEGSFPLIHGYRLDARVNGRMVEFTMPGAEPLTLVPAAVRGIAAVLASLAGQADAEPDPAEVDRVAALIASPGAMGIGGCRDAARRVLRAGYRPEPQP